MRDGGMGAGGRANRKGRRETSEARREEKNQNWK